MLFTNKAYSKNKFCHVYSARTIRELRSLFYNDKMCLNKAIYGVKGLVRMV